jgi:hypothetical protein
VSGTLIEAWASIKSFRRKDGSDDDAQGPGRNAERNFHTRSSQPTTRNRARLILKHLSIRRTTDSPARFCCIGHALMKTHNGLGVAGGITQASGTTERETALACWIGVRRRQGLWRAAARGGFARTVGHPHIAIDGHLSKGDKPRGTAMDWRTTRHPRLCDQPRLPEEHRRGVRVGQGPRSMRSSPSHEPRWQFA